MIKLVAIDLDGTLLTDAKTISDKNKQALAKAKEQGVKIVVCTGRPLIAIGDYLEELNLMEEGDYSITFNGGLIQKNNTGDLLGKTALDLEQVQDIYDLFTELPLPMDILSDARCLQLATAPKHTSLYPTMNKKVTYFPAVIEELTDNTLYNKVVAAIDVDYLDEKMAEIPAEYIERYEVCKTRPNLLEFMPNGVTKAYGLEVLGKELGISASEMLTLGDEANDLPMIEYAGIGVAMENATEDVKTAADHVTATNQADGVALAIEKFVLN
ncbi:Cof-type HAD-IIB family hydrolase [Candidatus Enterococcus ferrettii]|uniref:HAD superfamily hydrolase n=1 Tax=Candidatus Enterococcus ferrettii TaxID=2815324 RepID=A0ABV0EPU7_9ENTE|nr:Cof-type HAD-IIB family hydrolase [Enterococcus sp. 665A]MBO1340118.1 HAD family phosphatase [Enterococcus sp. 665A]